MKNKLLVSACAVAILSVMFTSCKPKTDFDAIANNVSKGTLQGYFSGAQILGENLVTSVAQYQFDEDGTVKRTIMEVGDGVYKAPVTTVYSSWEFGEYCDANKSRYLILTPKDGGEKLTLKYTTGGILEEGQPAAMDLNNKVSDIASTDTLLLNKVWIGNDTTYHKIDTTVDVMKYDSIFKRARAKDEQGKPLSDDDGNPIYIRVLDHVDSALVPTKMKWPIAPKTINVRKLELYRDPATLKNTGKWFMVSKAYDIDSTRTTKITTDTASAFDFRWAYETYSNSAAYSVKAVKENGTYELIDIRFDGKIPAITVDKQVLKIEE